MDKINLEWSALTLLKKEFVDAVTDAAGVFRLSYLHEDKNIYVFFVGESQSIKSKLLEILSSPENECVKFHVETKTTYFKFAPVSDEKTRDLVFRQIYKFYQPSCNEQMSINEDVIQININ